MCVCVRFSEVKGQTHGPSLISDVDLLSWSKKKPNNIQYFISKHLNKTSVLVILVSSFDFLKLIDKI